MVNWVTNGGCINGIRYADEALVYLVPADTDLDNIPNNQVIIVSVSLDGDDMDAISGDFFLEWRNVTDAGSFADLGSTGELRWGNVSAYANGDNPTTGELNGTENCSGMGVTPATFGIQRESANEINLSSVGEDEVSGHFWAVDLNFALAGKSYEFRITEAGGGSGVYKLFTAQINVVQAGKIEIVSRNLDSSSTVGSVVATAIPSDEAGSPKIDLTKKPAGQTTTNGSGVGTITGLVSGDKYFVHYYKDDTTDLADGTIEITAVDDV
jgi:hypothetical protein